MSLIVKSLTSHPSPHNCDVRETGARVAIRAKSKVLIQLSMYVVYALSSLLGLGAGQLVLFVRKCYY